MSWNDCARCGKRLNDREVVRVEDGTEYDALYDTPRRADVFHVDCWKARRDERRREENHNLEKWL